MIKKYVSFAAYLEDLYYNFIFEMLKSYIASNWRRMNLSTYSVPDPAYVEVTLLDTATVCSDRKIVFRFKNGKEIIG